MPSWKPVGLSTPQLPPLGLLDCQLDGIEPACQTSPRTGSMDQLPAAPPPPANRHTERLWQPPPTAWITGGDLGTLNFRKRDNGPHTRCRKPEPTDSQCGHRGSWLYRWALWATRLQTASSKEYKGYTMYPSMLVFQGVDNGSNIIDTDTHNCDARWWTRAAAE